MIYLTSFRNGKVIWMIFEIYKKMNFIDSKMLEILDISWGDSDDDL